LLFCVHFWVPVLHVLQTCLGTRVLLYLSVRWWRNSGVAVAIMHLRKWWTIAPAYSFVSVEWSKRWSFTHTWWRMLVSFQPSTNSCCVMCLLLSSLSEFSTDLHPTGLPDKLANMATRASLRPTLRTHKRATSPADLPGLPRRGSP
jgi:hypothetical protein